jgi:hypothetical protein
MQRKTATIERFHVYGTPRYGYVLTYRGNVIRWREGLAECWAQTADDSLESLQSLKARALQFGFTHVRITGNWERRTKPNGGKL